MDATRVWDDQQQKQLHRTVRFATKKHDGQFRKESGLPYISHPMAVLSQIAEWEIPTFVTWLAALTHDTMEDCGVSQNELEKVIGKESAAVVRELSFFPVLLNSEIPQHIQKKKYMKTFMTSSVHALVVKVADRCCNTCDWVTSGNHYAKKYWKKADTLFSAFTTRQREIVEFFGGPDIVGSKQKELGETIFTKMQYTRTCIDAMVQ